MPTNRPKVVKLHTALLDIIEVADELAVARSDEVARRFVSEVEKTSTMLARFPGLGKSWEDATPRLEGVRYYPAGRF